MELAVERVRSYAGPMAAGKRSAITTSVTHAARRLTTKSRSCRKGEVSQLVLRKVRGELSEAGGLRRGLFASVRPALTG